MRCMSTVGPVSKKEKAKFFEMILCSPGMAENCKISLKMTRQNALLLSRLIEASLLDEKASFDDDFLSALPEGSVNDFKSIHEEILRKAGLSEFYDKLKSI